MEEYGRAREATQDKVSAQERCELHAGKLRQEHKHTPTICNTYIAFARQQRINESASMLGST